MLVQQRLAGWVCFPRKGWKKPALINQVNPQKDEARSRGKNGEYYLFFFVDCISELIGGVMECV